MEYTIGSIAQIALLMGAIFFALLAGSGLVNLYLRYIDRLSIDKEDVRAITRNAGFALLLAAVAGVFHYLPFFMALGYVLCGVVLFQIVKIHTLLSVLKKR